MSRSSSPSRAALVFFSAGLALTTCLVGTGLWIDFLRTVEMRTNSRSALLRWQAVYASLKDAETGSRGYVITRDTLYLAPFAAANEQLPRQLMEATAAEQALKDGWPAQRIEQIHERLHELLNATREIVTVTQREGSDRAAELLKEGDAKARMDAVRTLLDERLSELDTRLRRLDGDVKENLTKGGRALAALAIAAMVASAAAGAMLWQALRQASRNEQLALDKQHSDRANREKSLFLATMSHEIRTPMNAILGFGELVLADARDDKQKRYATSIVRSGQALLQLINDILDFSKIEAGIIDLTPAPLDVRELAVFTSELFAHQCAEKGLVLQVEVEDGVPGSLLLDGARLRQVVINLVGNAVKFTSSGTVWLRFRGHGQPDSSSTFSLVVEVSDTGPGIPADRLESIFDPFVQAKVSRDAELKGTGLGLAIVKRLTGLMGGAIAVRSELGVGSTFIVELPKVEVSLRLAPHAGSVIQPPVDFNDLRPSTLLVVDDNLENLAVLHGYFEGTHHTIATAANGQEALDRLDERDRPDVVLMDIRMPVMDGRTALEKIRAKPGFGLLPVIAITASSLAHEEQDLREAFDGFVRKPFSRAQLFTELAQFIPPCEADEVNPSPEDGPVPAAWGPLARQLRALEHTRWPVVRDAMVMGEVTEFAVELQRLAAGQDCPPLEHLASRLLSEAESFSLAALEKSLAEFPQLVAHLEQRTCTPCL